MSAQVPSSPLMVVGTAMTLPEIPPFDIASPSTVSDSDDDRKPADFLIKGCWTPEEDEMLRRLVDTYGPRKWSKIASFLPGRIGKQCRERFFNHLDSSVNHARFSPAEDLIVARAHAKLGNQWATISNMLTDAGFHGRTSNAVKNHWNSTLARVVRDLQQKGVSSDVYSLDHFIYKCRRRRIPMNGEERTGKRRRIVHGNDEVQVERVEVALPKPVPAGSVVQQQQQQQPAMMTVNAPVVPAPVFVPKMMMETKVSSPVMSIKIEEIKSFGMSVSYLPTPTANMLADSWTCFETIPACEKHMTFATADFVPMSPSEPETSCVTSHDGMFSAGMSMDDCFDASGVYGMDVPMDNVFAFGECAMVPSFDMGFGDAFLMLE